MSKKSEQQYSVTEERLLHAMTQGTDPSAGRAWDRVQALKKLGHSFAVYYCEFNGGFSVYDESIPAQLKASMSISHRAKPFSG